MTSKKYHKKPAKQLEIAKKRIDFLFHEAKDSFRKNPKLSGKHIKLARRIAMKYKVNLPSELKKQFCNNCHSYLAPGVNVRVRLHKHRLIYYCLECRHYMRHPVK